MVGITKTLYPELIEQFPNGGSSSAVEIERQADALVAELDRLEADARVAQSEIYKQRVASIKHDLDNLRHDRKGTKNTLRKTENGRDGLLGNKQDRMDRRTDNNQVKLSTIRTNIAQLKGEIDSGMTPDERFAAEAKRIANSGAIITDKNGNVIGVDQRKLGTMDGATAAHIAGPMGANLAAGQDIRKGNITGKGVADAGLTGLVGGGMANAGYESKNIKTTITVAKLLVGLMIFNYYWNHTHGFGEKAFWGIALFGLLSNKALGGWDILRKGSQSEVLNVGRFFNNGATGEFGGYTQEMQKQHNLISSGKEKVQGLKSLFDDKEKLRPYLTFDGTKWVFNNEQFLTDYNLKDVKELGDPTHPLNADNSTPAEGKKPISDLNKDAAMGIVASLIIANKTGKDSELNEQLNAYLLAKGVDIKTFEDAMGADLDTKLAAALADLKGKAEAEATAIKDKVNDYLSQNYPGYVVVPGKEQEAWKAIESKQGSGIVIVIGELKNKHLIRQATASDVVLANKGEAEALITSLISGGLASPFEAREADALALAFYDMKANFPRETINAQLIVNNGKLYYQNHGRKVALDGRSQATGLAFDFNSVGINGTEAFGTGGFYGDLLVADAITGIWSVAAGGIDNRTGKMDKEGKPIPAAQIGQNKYPWKWSEGRVAGWGSGLGLHDEIGLFDFADSIGGVNTMIKKGIRDDQGRDILGDKLATVLNCMTRSDGKSIWPKGQGGLPNETLAIGPGGKVVEQGGSYKVLYPEVQTMGQLVTEVNNGIRSGASMVWGDVVDAVYRVGGDAGTMISKAIPAGSNILGIAYDETKKGVRVMYEDVAGGYEKNADGTDKVDANGNKIRKQGAIGVVYTDAVEGTKKLIYDAGDITCEFVDATGKVLDHTYKGVKEWIEKEGRPTLVAAARRVGKDVGEMLVDSGKRVVSKTFGALNYTMDEAKQLVKDQPLLAGALSYQLADKVFGWTGRSAGAATIIGMLFGGDLLTHI